MEIYQKKVFEFNNNNIKIELFWSLGSQNALLNHNTLKEISLLLLGRKDDRSKNLFCFHLLALSDWFWMFSFKGIGYWKYFSLLQTQLMQFFSFGFENAIFLKHSPNSMIRYTCVIWNRPENSVYLDKFVNIIINNEASYHLQLNTGNHFDFKKNFN